MHCSTGNKLPWSGLCEKTYWGLGDVSPQSHSVVCRLLPSRSLKSLRDLWRKIALLNTAQTWIGLADQVERAEGTTLGIPHPQSDEPDVTAMDNAEEPYDLITVLSRLEGIGREIGRGHPGGDDDLGVTATAGGQVFSEKCLDGCDRGHFGLTVRHQIKARPPGLTNC